MPNRLTKSNPSLRCRALWLELTDVLRNEEAWYIIDKALEEERLIALRENPLVGLLDTECTCVFKDEILHICEKHSKEILEPSDL
jgi:hypothetical protein